MRTLRDILTATFAVLVVVAVWFAVAVVASYCVMMGMGNVHDWWSFIPPMGFWDAFSITIWFAIPFGLYVAINSKDS